ncbi:MAG: hypothetical protein ACTHQ3_12745 [Motilibacteraceae bacterium]
MTTPSPHDDGPVLVDADTFWRNVIAAAHRHLLALDTPQSDAAASPAPEEVGDGS